MKQSFLGIRGYISVTDNFTFAYFLNLMCNVLLEIIAKFFNRRGVYFVCSLQYINKKFRVPTELATNILIKVKSISALLLMLLVCIGSYLSKF